MALSSAAGASPVVDNLRAFVGYYEGSKAIALIPATAKARIELKRSDEFIVYTMQTTVTWTLIERKFRDCSVIRIDGQRLLPLEFVHADESDPTHDVHTRFDWQQNKATTVLGNSAQAKVAQIAWPVWDPMSFQVALMALAQQRAAGESEKQRVVERGVAKEYRVSFVGAVPVEAPGRSVQAYEIISRKAKGQVALYLLPEQSWQPVRITVDDVTIDRIGGAAESKPSANLVAGQVPQCRPGPAQ